MRLREMFNFRRVDRRPDVITCSQVSRLLPGYLDGALPDREAPSLHVRIGQHLEACSSCRLELDRYCNMAMMVSALEHVRPDHTLQARILQAVSEARANGGVPAPLRRWKRRLELILEDIIEPLTLPATGGVLVALLVFATVYPILGAAIRLNAAVPDSPTNLFQPARLEMLAGFQMSRWEELSRTGGRPLLVEAMVNAEGQASSYRIISDMSGHVDPGMQHELDQVVLFSKFKPQMSFGRPTSGGRVVLSFSQIRVRG